MDGKQKVKKSLLFILKAAVIIMMIAVCWDKILCLVYINGNNMYPSVKDGDLCFVYRAADTYYANDVIAYRGTDGDTHTGRIVAVPGQEIDFPVEGGYTVNGWQPSESVAYATYRAENSGKTYPYTVQEEEYFVLNEFRTDVSDSRKTGCIQKQDIIGKIVFLLRRRGI